MIDTYDALVSKLIAIGVTGIDYTNDVAWDNESFDPAGKELWLSAYYMPATFGTDAKDQAGIAERGIFQVSVNIPVNDRGDGASAKYSRNALIALAEILTGFASGIVCEYNSVKVQILDSSTPPPLPGGGWWQSVISINYVRI